MKKLFFVIVLAIFVSGCSSSEKELNTCVGKTVKSIQKDFSDVDITFTDGTSITVSYDGASGVNVYVNK